MAGFYLRPLVKHRRLVGQKIECHAVLIFVPGFAGQLETQHGIHQAPFFLLKTAPEILIFGDTEIGNSAIEATGNTESVRVGQRDQPVAGALALVVATEPVKIAPGDCRPGAIIFWLDSQQVHDIGCKAEARPATGTTTVFKIQQVGASAAVKQLHRGTSLADTGKTIASSIGHSGQNAT